MRYTITKIHTSGTRLVDIRGASESRTPQVNTVMAVAVLGIRITSIDCKGPSVGIEKEISKAEDSPHQNPIVKPQDSACPMIHRTCSPRHHCHGCLTTQSAYSAENPDWHLSRLDLYAPDHRHSAAVWLPLVGRCNSYRTLPEDGELFSIFMRHA